MRNPGSGRLRWIAKGGNRDGKGLGSHLADPAARSGGRRGLAALRGNRTRHRGARVAADRTRRGLPGGSRVRSGVWRARRRDPPAPREGGSAPLREGLSGQSLHGRDRQARRGSHRDRHQPRVPWNGRWRSDPGGERKGLVLVGDLHGKQRSAGDPDPGRPRASEDLGRERPHLRAAGRRGRGRLLARRADFPGRSRGRRRLLPRLSLSGRGGRPADPGWGEAICHLRSAPGCTGERRRFAWSGRTRPGIARRWAG